MAVYGITRVSTLDQVEGTSLEEQRRKVEAIATVAGITVDHIYEDAGISGAVPLAERPQGREMVEALRPGDTVICAKIDRLFRSAEDALSTVKAWQDRGIDLIVVAFGADPVTANGTSKLLMGILAMVAEFERDLIRERLSDGRAAKRAKGGHIGGTAPFGYEKVGEGRGAMLQPIPAQQKAIDDMVSLRASGASYRAIADQIAENHGMNVSHLAVRNAINRRIDAD